jgi:F-type H+-transporting ATPase subunit b
MQIDWLTVAAQIVNFLILVWLLQRYLYRPIVEAMDAREQRIAARAMEAAQQQASAEREARAYRQRRDELEREKENVLRIALKEVDERRQSLEDAARQDVERRHLEWLRQLDGERSAFLREMRRGSAGHVLALSRRVLHELADARLEEQMAASFARHLAALEPQLRETLARACREAGGRATVRSRFELSEDARQRLAGEVRAHVFEGCDVAFEATEDLTGGIELTAGTRSLAWTLDRFLDDLERELDADLDELVPRQAQRPAA